MSAIVSPRRRLVALGAAWLFTVLWAVVCNATLDLVQTQWDWTRFVTYELDEAFGVFVLSSGLLWLLLVGMVAVTGRVLVSAGVVAVLSLVVAVANDQKLRLRAEPLFPSDLAFAGEAGFLTDMVGLRPVLTVGVVALVVTAALVAAGRPVGRHLPPIRRSAEPRTWRVWVAGRVVVVLAVAAVATQLASFNALGNPVKKGYVVAGARWAYWSQEANYRRHGVLAGLLYNLDVPPMDRPEDYGLAAMTDLTDRYTRLAERMNRGRDAELLERLNVVVVLSEALSDPTLVPGVGLDEDPIPFTRRLMATTTSGAMLSPQVGGGTANMEFEALTGLSLSQFQPQLTSPYPMLVADEPSFPSAVSLFERLGKRTLAVHPFDRHMYKRDRVYPALGFEEFVDQDVMGSTEKIGDTKYISDAAAFEEVQDHLEQSDEPLFVNLVTMQNHFPMAGKYDDPVGVTGVRGRTANQLGGYARGLRHSDDALRELVRGLRRSDEPTAVIVYGDHSPAFWARDRAFDDVRPVLRRTPFLMWSNVRRLPAERLPLTSPVYFLPLLLDRLGVPLPPFYALLTQLHEELPAMALGELHTTDRRLAPDEEPGERARALLADYRLVQYDLVAGERHAEVPLLSVPSAPPEQGGEGG